MLVCLLLNELSMNLSEKWSCWKIIDHRYFSNNRTWSKKNFLIRKFDFLISHYMASIWSFLNGCYKIVDVTLFIANLFNTFIHNYIFIFHITSSDKVDDEEFEKNQHISDRRLTRFRMGLGLFATGTEVRSQLT